MDSIIVRKLAEHEKVTAMQLSWDVFVEFDNTDCSEEGLRNFRNFIDDKEMVDSLDAYGAFDGNKLDGHHCNKKYRKSHLIIFYKQRSFTTGE